MYHQKQKKQIKSFPQEEIISDLIKENELDISYDNKSGIYSSANKNHIDLLKAWGAIYSFEIDYFTTTANMWMFFVRISK